MIYLMRFVNNSAHRHMKFVISVVLICFTAIFLKAKETTGLKALVLEFNNGNKQTVMLCDTLMITFSNRVMYISNPEKSLSIGIDDLSCFYFDYYVVPDDIKANSVSYKVLFNTNEIIVEMKEKMPPPDCILSTDFVTTT